MRYTYTMSESARLTILEQCTQAANTASMMVESSFVLLASFVNTWSASGPVMPGGAVAPRVPITSATGSKPTRGCGSKQRASGAGSVNLNVTKLLRVLHKYTGPAERSQLDDIHHRFAMRQLGKHQLQRELRTLCGQDALRQALEEMVPPSHEDQPQANHVDADECAECEDQCPAEEPCPICFEPCSEDKAPVPCTHCPYAICSPCHEIMTSVGHSKCPMCRAEWVVQRPPAKLAVHELVHAYRCSTHDCQHPRCAATKQVLQRMSTHVAHCTGGSEAAECKVCKLWGVLRRI